MRRGGILQARGEGKAPPRAPRTSPAAVPAPRYPRSAEAISQATAATAAEAGIVTIQAMTIRSATPHLTAERRRDAPTPMIAPVIVCVVETGMPAREAPISVTAPENSAHEPPTGLSGVIRIDMVRT